MPEIVWEPHAAREGKGREGMGWGCEMQAMMAVEESELSARR